MSNVLSYRRERIVSLYNIGFTTPEIASVLKVNASTVNNDVRYAINNGMQVSKGTVEERLSYGLRKYFMGSEFSEWDIFRRVKIKAIVDAVVKSLTLKDILVAETPYEALLFELGRRNVAYLAQSALYRYGKEHGQGISYESLVPDLKARVASDLRQALKFPIQVDESALEAALKTLPPRQEDVLRRRFFQGQTLEQIGDHYGRNGERIRQIEGQALRKLRKSPRYKWIIGHSEPQELLKYVGSLEQKIAEQAQAIEERDGIIAEYQKLGTSPTLAGKYITQPGLKTKLDTDIDSLQLSTRSYNGIRNANIKTIRGLVQKTEGEMLNIKNFGRKSLNELKEILASMGLQFGMRLPPEAYK